MATQAGHRSDDELSVLRMDYVRLLRRSREAFESGDARGGLGLLEMAAAMERQIAGRAGPDDWSPGERDTLTASGR